MGNSKTRITANHKVPQPVEPVEFPAVVVIDTREQLPFQFAGLRTDADQGNRPLTVLTVRAALKQGDYSLLGYEDQIAYERKSISDLYSTLGQDRARFVRELERLADYPVAGVIVEATWEDIVCRPPPHSKLNPKTVYRSILAWTQRYPRIHWFLAGPRRLAEVTTLRLLERFWRDRQEAARIAEKTTREGEANKPGEN